MIETVNPVQETLLREAIRLNRSADYIAWEARSIAEALHEWDTLATQRRMERDELLRALDEEHRARYAEAATKELLAHAELGEVVVR